MQEYDNPDSFAMAFDNAWLDNSRSNEIENSDKKLENVLYQVSSHPFFQNHESDARDIALFRIRLLELS